MKPQITSVLAALLLSGAPAFALDFGHGFSLTGDVELEKYDNGSYFDQTLGFGDLTLGWRSEGGNLGFDLTSVSLHDLDGGGDSSVVYGGLVLSTAFGDLTVGAPRPLMDTASPAPSLGLLRLYDLELGMFEGSYLATALLISNSNIDHYGASFTGTSGAASYGIAYHYAKGSGDSVDDIELVGGYDMGATHLYGGVEKLSGTGPDFTRVMIGAQYTADRWSAGAEYNHTDFIFGKGKAYSLYGDYEVVDGLKLGLQYLNVDQSGFDESLYGVSGEYSFGKGGFAQLGYVGSSGSSNDVASASIGFRF